MLHPSGRTSDLCSLLPPFSVLPSRTPEDDVVLVFVFFLVGVDAHRGVADDAAWGPESQAATFLSGSGRPSKRPHFRPFPIPGLCSGYVTQRAVASPSGGQGAHHHQASLEAGNGLVGCHQLVVLAGFFVLPIGSDCCGYHIPNSQLVGEYYSSYEQK